MFPTKHISLSSVSTYQVLPMNTHEAQISPFNPWLACHPTLSGCIMICCYCWMDAVLFNCFLLSDLFALLIFNSLFPSFFLPPKGLQNRKASFIFSGFMWYRKKIPIHNLLYVIMMTYSHKAGIFKCLPLLLYSWEKKKKLTWFEVKQVSMLYLPFPMVRIMNKLSSLQILCQAWSWVLHASLNDSKQRAAWCFACHAEVNSWEQIRPLIDPLNKKKGKQ